MKTYAEAKTNTPSRAHAAPVPNALSHQAQLRGALLQAGVQPRLEIGAINDPLEREADAAAGRVMLMAKPLAARENIAQAKASAAKGAPASPLVESELNALSRGGAPLDAASRAFFEPRFGHDFSGVRLHTDAPAARMAESINARAFTLGSDIAFAANSYSANTHAGRNLLSHELAHVVQQRSMNASAPQPKLVQRDPVTDEGIKEIDNASKGVVNFIGKKKIKDLLNETLNLKIKQDETGKNYIDFQATITKDGLKIIHPNKERTDFLVTMPGFDSLDRGTAEKECKESNYTSTNKSRISKFLENYLGYLGVDKDLCRSGNIDNIMRQSFGQIMGFIKYYADGKTSREISRIYPRLRCEPL